MRRTFVESSLFSKCLAHQGASTLKEIQEEILQNPEAGKVIPGTGGLRKIRVGDASRGKGKRGGLRVIYLDLPLVERTHLLALYGKDEKEDITPDEKRVLRTLVERLKKEAR